MDNQLVSSIACKVLWLQSHVAMIQYICVVHKPCCLPWEQRSYFKSQQLLNQDNNQYIYKNYTLPITLYWVLRIV